MIQNFRATGPQGTVPTPEFFILQDLSNEPKNVIRVCPAKFEFGKKSKWLAKCTRGQIVKIVGSECFTNLRVYFNCKSHAGKQNAASPIVLQLLVRKLLASQTWLVFQLLKLKLIFSDPKMWVRRRSFRPTERYPTQRNQSQYGKNLSGRISICSWGFHLE